MKYKLPKPRRYKTSRGLFAVMVAAFCVASNLGVASAHSSGSTINEQFTQNAGSFNPVSGGTWGVSGGTYNLTSPATAQSGNGNVSISNKPLTGSWTIQVDGKSAAANGEFSVIFDYSDPQNYAYAHFSNTLHDFSQGVFKVQGGNVNQIASYDSPLSSSSLQTVKVKFDSGKVKVYKGSTYLNGVDYAVRNGAMIGLGSTSSAVTFDNVAVDGTLAGAPIAPLPQVTPTPPVTPPTPPATCTNFQATRVVPVTSASELTAALANAQPGDDIQLASGTYAGNFSITSSGTASQPIRLTGTSAILDAGSVDGSPVLKLDHASNWCVSNLGITDGNKGVMANDTTNSVFDHLDVYNIGDEAVHLRSCSSNNIVQNSHIHDTGQRRDSFGEGVYLGNADSNWGVYNFCDLGNPDQSNYNQVLNNTFDHTAAEAIDAKEGTVGGVISGNSFDGIGMNGNHADSLIDVKGADYNVTNNTVTVSGGSAVVDGFQTHVIDVRTDETHSGTGNVFSGNTMNFPAGISGYGINIGNGSTALVTCDNIATGAALGMSNLACRP